MISYPGGDFTKLQKQLQTVLSEFTSEEKETLNICATGIGSNLHKKKLEEQLKLRYQILSKAIVHVCLNYSMSISYIKLSEHLEDVQQSSKMVINWKTRRLKSNNAT